MSFLATTFNFGGLLTEAPEAAFQCAMSNRAIRIEAHLASNTAFVSMARGLFKRCCENEIPLPHMMQLKRILELNNGYIRHPNCPPEPPQPFPRFFVAWNRQMQYCIITTPEELRYFIYQVQQNGGLIVEYPSPKEAQEEVEYIIGWLLYPFFPYCKTKAGLPKAGMKGQLPTLDLLPEAEILFPDELNGLRNALSGNIPSPLNSVPLLSLP